ncbi:MAG: hypothetical protein LBM41_01915 [Ruminococcus sp.]|jgi:hypothetical protein|nr:hypothetical protein [Ruminococcus sp.]
MAFPIVAPSFLREYVDMETPENNAGKVRYVISPHSVDYVLMLTNVDVAKRLIAETDTILYTMTYMSEADEKNFAENAKALLARYPSMAAYWPIRQMMMYVLQFPDIELDRKLLILNYCLHSVTNMQAQYHADLIPGFCQNMTHTTDFTEIFAYFKDLPVNPAVSAAEGVSLLKAVMSCAKETDPNGAAKKFKKVYERVFKGLEVSGPETFNMLDMKTFIKLRMEYDRVYALERPNIMENIMVNYLWAFAIPFTDPELSFWDNFTFYIELYNAIKVLIATTKPCDDDDLANILSAFDVALSEASKNNRIFKTVVTALKNQGTNNNGDLAVITVS